MKFQEWEGFNVGDWTEEINVRDFIQTNYTPYEGDSTFLKEPTEKTKKLWNEVLELYKKEKASEGGVLDIDTKTISKVAIHDAGYINKELEEIGLAAPQVTYIVHKLKAKGLDVETDAITIEEAAKDILAALNVPKKG